jgi:hypothetical protein
MNKQMLGVFGGSAPNPRDLSHCGQRQVAGAGLEFFLRLLSTFPHGSAVTTVGYRAVTLPWSGLAPN